MAKAHDVRMASWQIMKGKLISFLASRGKRVSARCDSLGPLKLVSTTFLQTISWYDRKGGEERDEYFL